MNNAILEICAYNIESCLIAQQAGAGRIELCASPAEGGVTPGYGTIHYALEKLTIPVYVMIRPRGGGFVYCADELAIMRKDIQVCKDLGVPGIAIGILTKDNRIDIAEMSRMSALAYPMGVTCHKAFDRTTDAEQALEDILITGCERILTSGLQPTAEQGADTLAKLVAHAAGKIIIMPGGGVRSTNIATLAKTTLARELHSSAILQSSTRYIADANEIKEMTRALR